MFWIVGADSVVQALGRAQGGLAAFFAEQLEHVPFEGFRFYDLVFPLFVFILGVSVVLSLDKILLREGRAAALGRILRRAALLFLLGVFSDGGFAAPPDQNVLCGVLQRLALCYLFTSLLYCWLKPRALLGAFFALLLGYWALLCFVPIPGIGVSLTPEANWPKFIDELLPPYHLEDAEGWLSTLPAVASCLLGVFAALLLKDSAIAEEKKACGFVAGGVLLAALGCAWGLQFPVVKRLWTSSYVLVAGGWSFALLGVFYYIIDIKKRQAWAQPFVWIGVNPLTIYLAWDLVDFRGLAERLAGGPLIALALCLLSAWFLYRKQVFLRL
ncbi:MAG TPA: DUF5009 domain-containing protein [Elusimicrobia bacterium]|nr:DUF5009 domain-containing protein [Elusimicrobiota bacterium]